MDNKREIICEDYIKERMRNLLHGGGIFMEYCEKCSKKNICMDYEKVNKIKVGIENGNI